MEDFTITAPKDYEYINNLGIQWQLEDDITIKITKEQSMRLISLKMEYELNGDDIYFDFPLPDATENIKIHISDILFGDGSNKKTDKTSSDELSLETVDESQTLSTVYIKKGVCIEINGKKAYLKNNQLVKFSEDMIAKIIKLKKKSNKKDSQIIEFPYKDSEGNIHTFRVAAESFILENK